MKSILQQIAENSRKQERADQDIVSPEIENRLLPVAGAIF